MWSFERYFRSESSWGESVVEWNNSPEAGDVRAANPKDLQPRNSLGTKPLRSGVGLTWCATDAADNIPHGCLPLAAHKNAKLGIIERRRRRGKQKNSEEGSPLQNPGLYFTHPFVVVPTSQNHLEIFDNHSKSVQRKRTNDNLYSFKTKLQ